ncbi:MAG: hypothetical protein R6V19_08935 [Armatimonadota bacterium]
MVDDNNRDDREPEDPLGGHEQDNEAEAEPQGDDMYDDLFAPEPDEPPQPPDDEPEENQSGGGGRSTGMMVLVGVLLVGILAAGAFAYKMYTDRADADRALVKAIDTLPAVAGPAGRDLGRQIADLRSAADEGQYEAVISGLQRLSVRDRPGDDMPPGMGGPQEQQKGGFELPEGPLPDEAFAELPEGARPFFKQHEELFKEFALQCNRSRALRDNGVDVDDLRTMRDSIIEAARLGQEKKVRELLAKMTKEVAQKAGGGRKQAPEELRKPLEEFAKVARQARSERRNIEPAMKLLQQAEQAAESGEIEKARKLIARATTSAKNAKKVTTQRRSVRVPRGDGENQRQRQQQSAALPQVILQGLLGMVSAEEADLAVAYKNIENAKIAMREKNADQIKSILDTALQRFENIAERRREFNQQMQKLMAEGPPQEPQEGREADGADGERQQGPRQRAESGSRLQQMITTGAVRIFEKIRGLSDEEFEQNKDELAGEVFALLRGAAQRAQRPQRPVVKDTEVEPAETADEKADAEDRIRAKMRLAHEPYQQLKESGENEDLVEQLETLFDTARNALYEKEYVKAEEAVNEGLKLLGLMEDSDTGPPAADTDTGESETIIEPLDTQPEGGEKPSSPGPELDIDASDIGSGSGRSDLLR